MRSLRALCFATATSLVACGGFLGFGDDDDEAPPASPVPDSSTAEVSPGPDVDPGPTKDASGDTSDDVAVDAIPSGDAGIDVIDTTPVDAGSEILVLARFENAVQGGDGADVAVNMEQAKTGLIAGTQSAHTLAGRPAVLGWAFAPQGKMFVSFSLRIVSMPSGAGAELMRLTGAGGTVSILIGSNGLFDLRSGGVDDTGAGKLSTNVVYRIGVEVDASGSIARAGSTTTGMPALTESVPWTPGGMDTLQIGTNDTAFEFLVDDVVVSTKGLQ